jgi:hypothetical protein
LLKYGNERNPAYTYFWRAVLWQKQILWFHLVQEMDKCKCIKVISLFLNFRMINSSMKIYHR